MCMRCVPLLLAWSYATQWIATYICKILQIGSAEMISNFAIQVFDLQNELFHCLMACVNNYAKITLSKIVAECN